MRRSTGGLMALILLLLGGSASAASFKLTQGQGYQIEPLYGYETVYRDYPSPHLNTHMLYGVRASAGPDYLSGELEYTRSSETENFSVAPQEVKTEDENLKLGIRSTYRPGTYLSASLRLGGQATQETRTKTSDGVTTKDKQAIRYNPYAGAALGVHFGPLSVNLSSTVIFKDMGDMAKNDFQNTISVGVGY